MKRITKKPWFSKKSKNPLVQGQPVTWQGWVVLISASLVAILPFIIFINLTIDFILSISAIIILLVIAVLTSDKREK